MVKLLKRWDLPAGCRAAVLVASIVLAVLTSGAAGLLVLAAVVAYALGSGDGGLVVIRKWQLWLFLAVLLLLSPFAIGQRDTMLWGIPFSNEGLWAGLYMSIRALTIAVAVTGFANTISVEGITRLFDRAGLAGLGFATGVAFNMLPTLSLESQSTFETMRLRGGFRRQRLARLKMLAVIVLTNALRHADDIVCAAEARAFGND
jgi:energy-coupling factor transporter transmembrane protein EcfT